MRRALALAVAAVLFAAPASGAGPRGSRESWTATGRILLPGTTLLTMTEWGALCPSMPLSQGVSGYVFEIPSRFATGKSLAHVAAKSRAPSPLPAGFFLSFKDATCDTLGTEGEASATVPLGTTFIFVTNYFDANEQIELTLRATEGL